MTDQKDLATELKEQSDILDANTKRGEITWISEPHFQMFSDGIISDRINKNTQKHSGMFKNLENDPEFLKAFENIQETLGNKDRP